MMEDAKTPRCANSRGTTEKEPLDMTNDSKTTEQAIRTWDTENEVAVAWGTHDAEIAAAAYVAEHLVPPFDPGEVPDFADGTKRWANPGVLVLDKDEDWPVDAMSDQPVNGWVPFMTWAW